VRQHIWAHLSIKKQLRVMRYFDGAWKKHAIGHTWNCTSRCCMGELMQCKLLRPIHRILTYCW